MRRAAIDVGSNSVLLVVADKTVSGWEPVFEDAAVTALGEGTRTTGLLGEIGMVNTLEAVARFYAKSAELGAERIAAAATMAARIAQNTQEFLDRAERQRTPITVLSGEKEAELGFRAVSEDALFAEACRISIVDPGGHSTELVTADRSPSGWAKKFQSSFPIGTLGLRGDFFDNERVSPEQIFKGIRHIDDAIGFEYRPNEAGVVVVLGASGTNLVTIRDRILEWDLKSVHGASLSYEYVSKAFGQLAVMSDAERAAIPGMERGRERTIHLGALILERFMHALRTDECRVSVRGWRHALLNELA
jgi:exopolyphosphatase / guanosine-5'-triphosphate,3'-diphosphate pyrophosphatase